MKELIELKRKIDILEKQCIGRPDSRELQDLKHRYYSIMASRKITDFKGEQR